MPRETKPRGRGQYHIRWCEPNDVWPKGGWTLYQINGDEIAQRVIFAEYNLEKGYAKGPVKFRHSWCGYIGMFENWEDLLKAIDKNAAELVTYCT